MDLKEFLRKIFLFFPPATNEYLTTEILFKEYEKALNTGCKYNYENAFSDLLRNHLKKSTPTCGVLKQILEDNLIEEFKPLINNGVTFKTIYGTINGEEYEFGIEPGLTEFQAQQNLVKRGFYNIRVAS